MKRDALWSLRKQSGNELVILSGVFGAKNPYHSVISSKWDASEDASAASAQALSMTRLSITGLII